MVVKKIIHLLLPAACLIGFVHSAHARDQTWMRNIVQWSATEKVQLWSAQEYRNDGFSLYRDPFVEFLEVGVRYSPIKTMYGAAGYRRQWNESGIVTVHENRWIAMVGAKTKPSANLTIAARLRFDGKYFDRSGVQDYIWYRFMINPSYRTRLAGVEVIPHAAVEIFGDTRPASYVFINRVRYHIGTSVRASGHLRPLIEYMRQEVHNGQNDHAIRLQLIWTI